MEKETKKKTTSTKKNTSSAKKTTSKAKTNSTKGTSKNVKKASTTKKEVAKIEKEAIKAKDTKKAVTKAVKSSDVKEEKNTKKIEENKNAKNEKIKKEVTKTKKENILDNVKMVFDGEIGSLFKILVIIIIVISVFFAMTNLINKAKENDDTVAEGQIQYEEILVSNILKQGSNEYYVLVYENEDLYLETFDFYINQYKLKVDALKVYNSVLSDNGFNRKYYDEKESNIIGANIDNLKFSTTTLVKVQNGSIVEAYTDPSSIIEYLKNISK